MGHGVVVHQLGQGVRPVGGKAIALVRGVPVLIHAVQAVLQLDLGVFQDFHHLLGHLHSLLLLLHLGAGDLRAGNAEKCAVSAREMRGNAYRMQTEGGDLNYTRMHRRCTGDALECAPNATRKKTYMPAVIPGRACRGASPLQPPMQPKMRRRRSECVRMRKNVMEYRMQECRRMHMRH